MTRQLRGADLLVRSLSVAGVERLFTLSGNQIMPVFDACLDEGIELLHVRHEAAAVHMADAWGRLTGNPGIALVTAGPGHANALSAMYVALAAESPLVLLSGHAPQSGLGRGVFQEMAQADMAGHVAKLSWTATDAGRLGHDLARAMRIARSGRPGPVHVSLPVDLLEAPLDDLAHAMPGPGDFQPPMSLLDAATAESVLAALPGAARPLILAGPAMTRGSAPGLLAQLAKTTHVPAIATESPRGINDPSLGALAEILAEADLVVLLAKRLDFTLRQGKPPVFRPDCRFIQLDPDLHVLEQTSRVLDDPERFVAGEIADPIPAVERLTALAQAADRPRTDWFDEVQTAISYRPPEWTTLRSEGDGPIHAVELCRAVGRFLDEADEAVFVSDGGEFGQWAQACLSAPRRVINGPAGSIGSGVPFAISAALAFPEARVVVTLGDGTFGFHAAEFDTAVRYNVPFVAVVGNDACWNAERQIQLRDYGPDRLIGCELLPTRYDQVVSALGGHGENVTRPEELQPALERAFHSGLPACVNVMIQRIPAPEIRRENGANH